jgi:hypothetical protein
MASCFFVTAFLVFPFYAAGFFGLACFFSAFSGLFSGAGLVFADDFFIAGVF